MNKMQPARGTKDLLPAEYAAQQHIIKTVAEIVSLYGYTAMSTPIFEFTEIFNKTLGDCSDIVTKEMYSFQDRGGESLTLRPEFTASIARAFISNGLHHSLPLKFFSHGPLFRYERPQKGRLRQFHQVNLECLGLDSPLVDSETIAMGAHILSSLGILEKTRLEINSLGDVETRLNYRKALVDYLSAFEDELSEDSKVRLQKNPLRILDSKQIEDKKIIANAPVIADYFSNEAQDFFGSVLRGLDELKIAYKINSHLVRGLDYYGHTAFEFITDDLGAQGTVLAGGRYDGLIAKMGGPQVPAIGFAAGIERLAALTTFTEEPKEIVIILPIGEKANLSALSLGQDLRAAGLITSCDMDGAINKRMKRANKQNAKWVIFIGEDELANDCLKIKNLVSGQEQNVTTREIINYIKGINA